MHSPFHEFHLLKRTVHHPTDYLRHAHAPGAVLLPDDLFGYVVDTLAWVPSLNPGRRDGTPMFGLNRYGPTEIDPAGAPRLAALFRSWAGVFALAPDSSVLTGCFSPTDQSYEQLTFERQEVLAALGSIASLAEGVDSVQYVLHLGI